MIEVLNTNAISKDWFVLNTYSDLKKCIVLGSMWQQVVSYFRQQEIFSFAFRFWCESAGKFQKKRSNSLVPGLFQAKLQTNSTAKASHYAEECI